MVDRMHLNTAANADLIQSGNEFILHVGNHNQFRLDGINYRLRVGEIALYQTDLILFFPLLDRGRHLGSGNRQNGRAGKQLFNFLHRFASASKNQNGTFFQIQRDR